MHTLNGNLRRPEMPHGASAPRKSPKLILLRDAMPGTLETDKKHKEFSHYFYVWQTLKFHFCNRAIGNVNMFDAFILVVCLFLFNRILNLTFFIPAWIDRRYCSTGSYEMIAFWSLQNCGLTKLFFSSPWIKITLFRRRTRNIKSGFGAGRRVIYSFFFQTL